MFPKRVTRISCSLLQISCKLQLFAQRASVLNRLGLPLFPLPDIARNRKQVIGTLRRYENTAVVIGEHYVRCRNDEVPEPRGEQGERIS